MFSLLYSFTKLNEHLEPNLDKYVTRFEVQAEAEFIHRVVKNASNWGQIK